MKILSIYLICVLVSGWNWWIDTKIVLSAFRPFTGHHPLLAYIKGVF